MFHHDKVGILSPFTPLTRFAQLTLPHYRRRRGLPGEEIFSIATSDEAKEVGQEKKSIVIRK